jgi:transglutaminase-like putative cysteine protease
VPPRKYQAHHWDTNSLEDHIALIERQVKRSLRDPGTRQLAVAIVSGVREYMVDPRTRKKVPVVAAWGRFYQAPEVRCKARDEACEIQAIWDFLVLNVRYVLDIVDVDTYSDLKSTLEVGGGDCDDFTIAFAALLKGLGYNVRARVISIDGRSWAHIYPMVELPKGGAPRYVLPLDATEDGKKPGWEFKGAAKKKDFEL